MANYTDRYYRNLYRQQNAPHTSLAAAGFTPAAFTPMVYEAPNNDVSILQRSLANLDERKEKTDQQRAAIETAIGNLKLAEEEDAWKTGYIDRIQKEIDNAAQYGDYSSALEVATKLAGKAVSSPEVTGRLRYQQNREEWLKNLETRRARKEIDSDTYARAKEQNVYNYADEYDANGNIIGGSDWTPEFEPVNDIDITQVISEIKAMVTPSSKESSSKGGTSQIYLDKNGNKTTDINQAYKVYATVSGGGGGSSHTGVTAEQWANAFDAWMDTHRTAVKAFNQKYQNDLWNYQKFINQSNDTSLSEKERNKAGKDAEEIYDRITDADGGLLSAKNYARSITNPTFKVMEFSRTGSHSEGGSTLFNEEVGKNRLQAEILGLGVDEAEIYGMGSPAQQIAILENHANTSGGLNAAAKAQLEYLKSAFRGNNNGNNNGLPKPQWQQ